VAAHLGMLTRKAATESRATTGEMASAEPAAHAGAAAEPTHVSGTHVAATEPAAHMSATPETPAVSTPTTASTPTSPAARERISGQSPVARRQLECRKKPAAPRETRLRGWGGRIQTSASQNEFAKTLRSGREHSNGRI
jgi:hypothetical protein